MKRALLALLLGAITVPALAADKWILVRSQNFALAGSATERQIREVAYNLELFRSAYSRLFPVRASSVQTTILVFKSDAAFRPYKPLYRGKPANIAAYFQQAEDVNHIALSAEDADPAVIYHEYVHSLMADSVGDLPLWFAEGIAEYYSTFTPIGNGRTFMLGRPIGEHVSVLKERGFIPLARLFAVEEGSADYNEDEKQGIFYAESWALVHYLMNAENRKYEARIPELLAALQSGKTAAEAFNDVLHVSIDAFQKTLEAYVGERQAFPALQYKTPEALDPEKDMKARTLTEAEGEYQLGDLLLHMERFADADTHLKKAIQLDAKLASAHASTGRLMAVQKRHADAMPAFERAVELEPANHLAHFYYGESLWNQTEGAPPSAARDAQRGRARVEAQRAVELAPQFVLATELVARINLAANDNLDETKALLDRAREIFPSRDSLALFTAFVLSRTAERDAAPPMLAGLIGRLPQKSFVRQEAQGLLDSMKAQAIQRAYALGDQASSAVSLNGVLTRLECVGGWTLSVTTGGRSVSFRAAMPQSVRLIAYSPEVRSLTCGQLPLAGIPVIVTYRPLAAGAAVVGEPLMIEMFRSN